MQWFQTNLYALALYGGLALTLIAGVLVLVSVERERQVLVLAEIRQALRWGLKSFVRQGHQFYVSESADELLETMGIRKYISSSTLKMSRDALSLVLLIILLLNYSGEELIRPLTWLAVFYLTLTPGPGPFYAFIRPLFQRIHRYRVSRDTALLIQLFRNEMQSSVPQSVDFLIREYRVYMTVIQDDMYWLEHEWQKGNKEEALQLWERKHPGNQDIRFLCGFLRKLDEIGYEACAEMLSQNERTINRRQVSNYLNRMQDLNRFLFFVNAAGVLLACLWFVMSVFSWSFDMDMG
ncbi:hypothetical protein [Paenibacillus elgii]|uniref:hypothetical protein n=1 Tax=Paenibacillus elgii TaxID=189691 RepID=UPI0013D88D14|nr:hypothetical protein [Paenibacillus elgii]